MFISVCGVACVLLSLVVNNEAARILAVYPVPSISHQVVFRPLMQELAKRGHEVVVLTTDPAFPKGHAPENLTEIDLHDLSYTVWRRNLSDVTKGNSDDLHTQLFFFLHILNDIFEMQIQTKEVQDILNDKRQTFDLLFVEACMRQALVFSHVHKVPVIQISSMGGVWDNYKTIGAPTHPLLYPELLRQKIYNITMWEKIKELYSGYKFDYLYNSHEDVENEMLKRNFGPDVPALSELSNNIDMLFLNVNPIWEGNRPVPPTVVHMGRLHLKPEKELPKDLKKYLDSSVSGVIYISFGTNINPSFLPREKIEIFLKVFSQLPYDILWKWDKDELPGKSKNIKISKWLPQSDLLRHPNIKLFITQCGLQSTDEAIVAGVPLIGIPMLGDQWFNAEKYVYHKIGVRLDMETLTEEKFKNAVNTVIEDKSYRQNMVRLRSIMLDQPQTPLERAVWWTEYVLRHGGARHLRSPAANISWAEYLELKLVSVLLLGSLGLLSTAAFVSYTLFKFVSSNYTYRIKMKSA